MSGWCDLELRYGQRAAEYKRWWAPVLASFARPMLDALEIAPNDRALDLGGGVGTLSAALRRKGARVTCLDGSPGMLRRAPRTIDRVAGDITRAPFGDHRFEVLASTFVFQHVPTPRALFREAARMLARGGVLATATWGASRAGDPGSIAEPVLRRLRVPADPVAALATFHDRYDAPAKMARLARGAGLVVERCWSEERAHRFTAESYLGFVSGMGAVRRRLLRVPERRRARVIDALERELGMLPLDALVYRPEIVYLLARRRRADQRDARATR